MEKMVGNKEQEEQRIVAIPEQLALNIIEYLKKDPFEKVEDLIMPLKMSPFVKMNQPEPEEAKEQEGEPKEEPKEEKAQEAKPKSSGK